MDEKSIGNKRNVRATPWAVPTPKRPCVQPVEIKKEKLDITPHHSGLHKQLTPITSVDAKFKVTFP